MIYVCCWRLNENCTCHDVFRDFISCPVLLEFLLRVHQQMSLPSPKTWRESAHESRLYQSQGIRRDQQRATSSRESPLQCVVELTSRRDRLFWFPGDWSIFNFGCREQAIYISWEQSLRLVPRIQTSLNSWDQSKGPKFGRCDQVDENGQFTPRDLVPGTSRRNQSTRVFRPLRIKPMRYVVSHIKMKIISLLYYFHRLSLRQ